MHRAPLLFYSLCLSGSPPLLWTSLLGWLFHLSFSSLSGRQTQSSEVVSYVLKVGFGRARILATIFCFLAAGPRNGLIMNAFRGLMTRVRSTESWRKFSFTSVLYQHPFQGPVHAKEKLRKTTLIASVVLSYHSSIIALMMFRRLIVPNLFFYSSSYPVDYFMR